MDTRHYGMHKLLLQESGDYEDVEYGDRPDQDTEANLQPLLERKAAVGLAIGNDCQSSKEDDADEVGGRETSHKLLLVP